MEDKLWAGRFSKETAAAVDRYNRSIAYDSRMYPEDIAGSMAHAAMLAKQGVISTEDGQAIQQGLASILKDLDSGALAIDPEAEDIHTFIESELTRRVQAAGKRLHTGRSRNDQVATDFKLYLKHRSVDISRLLTDLISETLNQAQKESRTILPGYTHLQRAQPITLGHHLCAYAHMLLRDLWRLQDWTKRNDSCPLGAGALATSTYPLDREMTAHALGFARVATNSLDAVGDRDYAVELVSVLAMLMLHLSRWSEEFVLWSSQEFHFVELDDAYSTGSSIMPQKKNPDVAELTRGKSARVIGSLNTLMVMLKGIPLAYNKDLQEDKEATFDAIDTVTACLPAFTGMLATAIWQRDTMRAAAARGFTNATDLADYLVKKGLPFRDAHHIVGHLVAICSSRHCGLEDLSLPQLQTACSLIGPDVYQALDLQQLVDKRNLPGGPAPAAVLADIQALKQQLKQLQASALN
ncbi:MAG: argininosuccinate lyase [Oscillospiraceae bacterium]|nr:argininosuccinate lyase [Oscillospiraceae bacterium]MDD4368116.1 argininosuccinate lyase [Oscillospiraceae bacterium]